MPSAKSVLVLIGLGALGLNTVAACSSTSSPLGFDDGDAGFTASLPEAGGPAADTGTPHPETDSSVSDLDSAIVPPPADAAIDAPVDAAPDAADAAPDAAGPDAGPAGSACPTKDLVGKQTCGLCGFQTRLCAPSNAGDPASPLTWQEWGFCQSEVAGGCVPGTSTSESCGLCGTRNKVCQIDCQYAVGACKSEPANACAPGTIDFQSGLSCAEGGRSRTCAPTCQYGSFGDCFVPGEPTLTLTATAGAKTSGQFTLALDSSTPRLSGTCPTADAANSATAFQYVLLDNPTASTLVVSVWTSQSTNVGSAYIDTVIATYASSTKPATVPAREACTKGVNDTCSDSSDPTSCKSSWGGLLGSNAITLAPHSKAYVYVAAYYASGKGDYQLTARTDSAN